MSQPSLTSDTGSDLGRGVPLSVILWTFTRWWPALIIIALVAGLLTSAAMNAATPRYQSTGRVLIGSLQGPLDGLRASASLGATYADVLTSPGMLQTAAKKAGIAASDLALADAVSVTANDKSRVLTIESTWDDPKAAQKLTTEVMNQVAVMQKLTPKSKAPEGLTAEGMQLVLAQQLSGQTTTMQGASLPLEREDTHSGVLSAMAGLVSAFAAFVLLTFLVARRRRNAVNVRSGVRRQGLLGLLPVGAGDASVVISAPTSAPAQEYLEAAAHTEVRAPKGLDSLGVLALRAPESSREVATNLAAAYASAGRQVTLLDTVEGGEAAAKTEVGKGSLTVLRLEPSELQATLANKHKPGGDQLVLTHLSPALSDRRSLSLAGLSDAAVLVAHEQERSAAVGLADASQAIERRGGTVLGSLLVYRRGLLNRMMDAPE